MGQAPGFLGLQPAVLLSRDVIRRLRQLDETADLDDGLALGDHLLGGLEVADDLLRRVHGAFHAQALGPVWPDEDSHSTWTDFRYPGYSHISPDHLPVANY